MRSTLALLLLVLPVSGFSAELVKKSKTKAVLNFKKSELTDLEVGEEVYLVDAADEVAELMVDKINGQMVTVTGKEIADLESGVAYQVRLDKPNTRHVANDHGTDDDHDEMSASFQAEFAYGKRWNKADDTTNQETLMELRFAFQPDELPLSFGVYYNIFMPQLNTEAPARIVQNRLRGSEYGLRVEANHNLNGFMPFLGIRVPLHKEMSGEVKVIYDAADFFGTEVDSMNYEYQTSPNLDLGFRFVKDNVGFFALGQKSVSEKMKAKIHVQRSVIQDTDVTNTDATIKGDFKSKFDSMTFGVWLAF